jgi:predicted nuclease with TOPRIM domain
VFLDFGSLLDVLMADEPLLPRNTTGIGIAAVLLTAGTTSLGFLAQRALDLDERVITLQEQQRDDEEANILLREMSVKIANIESVQQNRMAIVDLVIELDERMNRQEAHYEDLKSEFDGLRNDQ